MRTALPTTTVHAGDTYERIARLHGVDPARLREINGNKAPRANEIFRIPPRQVVTAEDPEVARLRRNSRVGGETALVQVSQPAAQTRPPMLDVNEESVKGNAAPEALAATPDQPVSEPPSAVPAASLRTQGGASGTAAASSAPRPSGKTYKVKKGDSIWRIARNHKVSQAALLKANGNLNPRKMRIGMTLVIPE